MRRVAHWLRRFLRAIAGLGVLAYALAALVTVADILGRQVGVPIDGVVDLVQLFVMAGAWLVMPYAFMAGAHVGVDFLVGALPAAPAAALRLIAATLAFTLLALMLWQGVLTYETRTMFGDRSQQLGIPIAWYWWPLLAGLALSLLGVALAGAESSDAKAKQ
ncbi:TRAP transporter small permease subunit [Pikeienuella piscinae]|uniref:TRAP transporter small permease protein n=1 Tax=Pikeienuella piscinae TaxID=2748098 RepID=A0A7L5BV67_9RHOB|nr:TRAP transporter small permease subunit [Pikeienuella piscinae]QIE54066.1 TRAP transporter small permease subunit [Pikeienuella piscinae]